MEDVDKVERKIERKIAEVTKVMGRVGGNITLLTNSIRDLDRNIGELRASVAPGMAEVWLCVRAGEDGLRMSNVFSGGRDKSLCYFTGSATHLNLCSMYSVRPI